MSLAVQQIVTILVVFAAAAYILSRAWQVIAKKKAGCGTGCAKCPASESTPGNFVSLEIPASGEQRSNH